MKTLILGAGEIGKSLFNVLSNEYEVDIYDISLSVSIGIKSIREKYDIIHICFPYMNDKTFISSVSEYQRWTKCKYTVIHSTVPPGTSESCNATHSPVIGIHPNLEKSLKTFTKYLSGPNASEVANYFRRAGMTVYIVDNQKTTEIMKILCTTQYALMIEWTKEVKKICKKFEIPFEFFTLWNYNYNNGYKKLDCNHFCRPNLVPILTEQGGHCTINNLKLFDTNFSKLIEILNRGGTPNVTENTSEN